jgi:hypothetical protein
MTNTSSPRYVLLKFNANACFYKFIIFRLLNEGDFSDCVDGQSKVLKFPGKIAINDDGKFSFYHLKRLKYSNTAMDSNF